MNTLNILSEFSNSLEQRFASAHASVVAVRNPSQHVSGFLWEPDVIVTSEQAMGEREEYEVVNSAQEIAMARIVGRDPSTNMIVLKADRPLGTPIPNERASARSGELVFAIASAFDGTARCRLGVVNGVGPEWHSRLGGRIDGRITLDIRLHRTEEGGVIVDSSGAVLGMSTLGSTGQILVIPVATIERVVPQLLTDGQVARGWLGVGLQPVAVPESLQAQAGQKIGMMVMSLAEGGPAIEAGMKPGDIVLSVDARSIADPRRLVASLTAEQVGKVLAVRLIRGGEVTDLNLTVAARPNSKA
jgi:S1-C subfamily serine protease